MLDKYIKINESRIICGQTSSGIWYCKELPAEDTKQLEDLIGKINKILNIANKKTEKKEGKKSPPKPSLVKM